MEQRRVGCPEAGRLAAGDAKPITDFRASAEYRRDLIAVLTKRALEGAYELAKCVVQGVKDAHVDGLTKYVADDFGSFDPAHPDPVADVQMPSTAKNGPAGGAGAMLKSSQRPLRAILGASGMAGRAPKV